MSNKNIMIILFIMGLFIGNNLGLIFICKEKDKTISLIGKIKLSQTDNMSEVPKNLPIVTDFKK